MDSLKPKTYFETLYVLGELNIWVGFLKILNTASLAFHLMHSYTLSKFKNRDW